MRHRYEQLGVVVALALAIGGGPGAAAQARASDDAPQGEPAQAELADERLLEANRLTGASLVFQREQRELRERLRDRSAALDERLGLLEEVEQLLEASEPNTSAAEHWRGVVARAEQESSQILRWLRGEDLPEEPGLTRASLRLRLEELAGVRRDARLRAHACALADAVERAQLREDVSAQARDVREWIRATTQPMRDQLAEMDALAAQQGEPFEQVMATMGRLTDDGPVMVMAVRADAWFEHGLVSFRWTDRRGQLVASAQVRLLPSISADTSPPLLLDRFPILSQSEHEAEFLVGHFSVAFHTAVPELAGEAQVLQAAADLLDLDTLEQVRPSGTAPDQH